MAVGAQDNLDRALVKKYQSLKVDNAVIQSSMIDPNKLMDTMNDYANAHMEAFRIQNALRNIDISLPFEPVISLVVENTSFPFF